jgi:hypothetical protein
VAVADMLAAVPAVIVRRACRRRLHRAEVSVTEPSFGEPRGMKSFMKLLDSVFWNFNRMVF